MNILILVETKESYKERQLDNELEPIYYNVDFNFRNDLLDYFLVDEVVDRIEMSVRGHMYVCENTEENRDKLSLVLNNRIYEN